MSIRRNFMLNDKANIALESMHRETPDLSYSQIVSDALSQYFLWRKQEYVGQNINDLIQGYFQSIDQRLDVLQTLLEYKRSADSPQAAMPLMHEKQAISRASVETDPLADDVAASVYDLLNLE